MNAQQALDHFHKIEPELLRDAPKDIRQWHVPQMAITFEGSKDGGLNVKQIIANGTCNRYLRRLAAGSGETVETELRKLIENSLWRLINDKGLETFVTWSA